MNTPSNTPITDAMLKKPGFSPSEWIESHRSLETAAQGLRDALGVLMNWAQWQIDLPPMRAEIVRTELARFDALKEGK